MGGTGDQVGCIPKGATDIIPDRVITSASLRVAELGFGAASLGNLYREMSNAEAEATVEAALAAGMTYLDTAPHYGFGLSERRLGDVLRDREGFVVSTKVGRLLRPLAQHRGTAERSGFLTPMPFEPVYDYGYDAIMRSYEDSLQRLGLARIDILYVHDIGPLTHSDRHAETFAQLTGGGFRALEELRSTGAIGAFGLGVNEWEICTEAMNHADLDVVLLAGRYTLLEQGALDTFLPACERRSISVVVGGAFNSGILATGTRRGGVAHYDYAPAPPAIVERVARLEAVCDRHDVALPAAALQFPLAHRQVVSVIPGIDQASRVRESIDLYSAPIPTDFWAELNAEGLVRPDAPTPEGRDA